MFILTIDSWTQVRFRLAVGMNMNAMWLYDNIVTGT